MEYVWCLTGTFRGDGKANEATYNFLDIQNQISQIDRVAPQSGVSGSLERVAGGFHLRLRAEEVRCPVIGMLQAPVAVQAR